MQSFDYGDAADIGEALANGDAPNTVFLAGGTELLNWLRLGVAKPARVIDLAGPRDLPTSRACRGAGSASVHWRGSTTLRSMMMWRARLPGI
jgi:xanthine dehydrogenase YagS FAD-binding subunit